MRGLGILKVHTKGLVVKVRRSLSRRPKNKLETMRCTIRKDTYHTRNLFLLGLLLSFLRLCDPHPRPEQQRFAAECKSILSHPPPPPADQNAVLCRVLPLLFLRTIMPPPTSALAVLRASSFSFYIKMLHPVHVNLCLRPCFLRGCVHTIVRLLSPVQHAAVTATCVIIINGMGTVSFGTAGNGNYHQRHRNSQKSGGTFTAVQRPYRRGERLPAALLPSPQDGPQGGVSPAPKKTGRGVGHG